MMVPAAGENFPAEGVTVTLPYPSGTDSSWTFHAAHMFTSSAGGKIPGEIEYPAVEKAASGLLTGFEDGTFRPSGQLTRAQLAQILYNLAGKPPVQVRSLFADAAPDAWYANAVAWAAGHGVASGYGNGRFGPNDSITREQLAVMLWRYSGASASTHVLPFSDAEQASSWALDALRWAAEKGVVNGSGTQLLPQGTATRAQTARMLKNLLDSK